MSTTTSSPVVHVETSDALITCPIDGTLWRMFPAAATPMAYELALPTPGRGRPMFILGGVHYVERGRVPILRLPDDGISHERYEWTCSGHTLTATTPAVDLVTCTHGNPDGCEKHQTKVNPPADLYTNPRHGGQCICCGHQGSHWLRRDRAGYVPMCQR